VRALHVLMERKHIDRVSFLGRGHPLELPLAHCAGRSGGSHGAAALWGSPRVVLAEAGTAVSGPRTVPGIPTISMGLEAEPARELS
jgi:hypothetical protein